MDNPTITINGKTLTFAQALTIHVALQNFLMDLADAEFREAIGPALADSYKARVGEVNQITLGADKRIDPWSYGQ